MKEPIIALGITLLLIFVLIWVYMERDKDFAFDCHSKGGHIVELYGPNICVTDDGKIIPVED